MLALKIEARCYWLLIYTGRLREKRNATKGCALSFKPRCLKRMDVRHRRAGKKQEPHTVYLITIQAILQPLLVSRRALSKEVCVNFIVSYLLEIDMETVTIHIDKDGDDGIYHIQGVEVSATLCGFTDVSYSEHDYKEHPCNCFECKNLLKKTKALRFPKGYFDS